MLRSFQNMNINIALRRFLRNHGNITTEAGVTPRINNPPPPLKFYPGRFWEIPRRTGKTADNTCDDVIVRPNYVLCYLSHKASRFTPLLPRSLGSLKWMNNFYINVLFFFLTINIFHICAENMVVKTYTL